MFYLDKKFLSHAREGSTGVSTLYSRDSYKRVAESDGHNVKGPSVSTTALVGAPYDQRCIVQNELY